MYLLNIILWCYVLLFIASSSQSLRNSTNSDEQRDNSTVRSILQDDLQNDSTLQKFNENLIKTEGENVSHEFYQNSNSNDHNNSLATIVSYEACDNNTCIQLCCPFGYHLSRRKCVAGRDNYSFPDVYWNNSENKKLDELFQLTVRDPCVLEESAHSILNPDEYSLLVNGSLYLERALGDPGHPSEPGAILIPSTSYCLAVLDRNIYDVIICKYQLRLPTYTTVLLLISLPFLLVTFVVYAILPELQNIHGCTVCVYVITLFNIHLITYLIQEFPELSEMKYCMPLAYIFNFSMMSGIFWLNVMCFDIWWTFRKLKLNLVKIKHQQTKKFVIYAIYAWGTTVALNVICAIMDHVPGISKYLIRPEMCKKNFGSVVCIYGVMGVSWILGTILWVLNASISVPRIVWNISYTIDILRGPIVFIIFVCQKKILRLLLKRFGWHGSVCNILKNNHFTNTFPKNTFLTVSMQSFSSSNQQTNHYAISNKPTFIVAIKGEFCYG